MMSFFISKQDTNILIYLSESLIAGISVRDHTLTLDLP
ncbi:Uncharacterized protein ChrSV_4036 [Chromobacterium vaccinii]|nr:Uncharacterized protein ChrSW_4036 [Chromobacterium vaccinii]QND91493.1 Uncharacterized protein ChrSV_4036 [Chromobacterium vaccinii]